MVKPIAQVIEIGNGVHGGWSSDAAAGVVASAGETDWHELFVNLKARLRLAVDAWLAPAEASLVPGASMCADLIECNTVLEQLHRTLARESSERRRLQAELAHATAALAVAREEAMTARAGEVQARHRAEHDSLTALPNRAFFRSRLDQMLENTLTVQQSAAVLYLDLDNFKPINDTHGHDIGDELLRIVATRLTRAMRHDDVVGRLGGDEFACLLLNLPTDAELRQLAAKLIEVVSAPIQIDALRLQVNPSIGIALIPRDTASPAMLMKYADAAMYHAKQSRSGYAFYSSIAADAAPTITSI